MKSQEMLLNITVGYKRLPIVCPTLLQLYKIIPVILLNRFTKYHLGELQWLNLPCVR